MNNIYFISGTNISKRSRADEWNKNRARNNFYADPVPNIGISEYNNSFTKSPYSTDDLQHISPINGITSLSFYGVQPKHTFSFIPASRISGSISKRNLFF